MIDSRKGQLVFLEDFAKSKGGVTLDTLGHRVLKLRSSPGQVGRIECS
jgi:hypothetical protein